MSGLFKSSLAAGLVTFGLTYFIGLAAQEEAVTAFKKKIAESVGTEDGAQEEPVDEATDPVENNPDDEVDEEETDEESSSEDDDLF